MTPEESKPNIELQALHLASSAIIEAGFEVARPERDTGADLLIWRSHRAPGTPLRAYPVQVKGFAGRPLKFNRKYRAWPDMIHLHVLEVGTKVPQIVGWLYPMWWKLLHDTGTAAGGTAKSWNHDAKDVNRLEWWTQTMNEAQEAAAQKRLIDGEVGIARLAEWADHLSGCLPCPDCFEPRVPVFAGPQPPAGAVEAGVAVIGTCVVDENDDGSDACVNVNCARFHDRDASAAEP